MPPTLCSRSRSYMVVSENLIPLLAFVHLHRTDTRYFILPEDYRGGEDSEEESARRGFNKNLQLLNVSVHKRGTRLPGATMATAAFLRRSLPLSSSYNHHIREGSSPAATGILSRMLGCGEIPVFDSARASLEISRFFSKGFAAFFCSRNHISTVWSSL